MQGGVEEEDTSGNGVQAILVRRRERARTIRGGREKEC
jgi:hypothetical protein